MNNALGTQSAPYSQEAEESVLGALLVNPEMLIIVVVFLKYEDFFFIRHAYVYQAMLNLFERNEPIDYTTLIVELQHLGWLEEIGGPAYITYLINNTPTSVYAEVYGRLVERAAVRRRLMMAADEIKALALNEELTREAVELETRTKVDIVFEGGEVDEIVSAGDLAHEFLDELESDDSMALPTGFRDLDELLAGGFRKRTVNIIGGRPGMGKTAFLLCIARNMTGIYDLPFGFFSFEMDSQQVMKRLVSMETGIPTTRIDDKRKLRSHEISRILEVVERLSKLPLYVDKSATLDPVTLKAKVRRMQRLYGVQVVGLDYIQLMNGGVKFARSDNPTAELTYISNELRKMAKTLNIPILAAAQLNRNLEHRQDKRPILADLKESGSLEQDAYTVIFPYRDVVHNEATEFPNQADIILAKHRNGPTGTTSLYFDKSITKFTDAATRRIDLDDDGPPPPKREKTIQFSKASGGSHAHLSQPEEKD